MFSSIKHAHGSPNASRELACLAVMALNSLMISHGIRVAGLASAMSGFDVR